MFEFYLFFRTKPETSEELKFLTILLYVSYLDPDTDCGLNWPEGRGGLFRKLTNIPSVCLIKCHAQFDSHLVSVTITVDASSLVVLPTLQPLGATCTCTPLHTNHYVRTNKHKLIFNTDWQLATFSLPEM